ncbi:trehalose 6-phosphate synthase/phosphatase complex subunit NDAI_0E00430 [Naumovozyma dairenensis CBS 421]|uniref:Uncharacterized protein n=1 Tax=Naumovozyma dairenensis (strain ATCC 10597 / BCRC 20456 / CBS 421 / NBRC 0211 / NRRL Y-12639) TaxID=1071378 RepID=G0WAT9_NAUDC|nr:hypothetical protein NDAI_0E00430 [Naumovozyma dairenensis CBS 421]CCD24859.1 hypothetical protein NDAI_0E00430 [Naumovozyma dairenensis CBS 421]
MTIIVASLFLPYTPQFEVIDPDAITSELAESNLIKVVDNNENIRKKRTSSVHSASPFLLNNLSQESMAGAAAAIGTTHSPSLEPLNKFTAIPGQHHQQQQQQQQPIPSINISSASTGDLAHPNPLTIDEVVSSEQFMENLTASGTVSHTPALSAHHHPAQNASASVEEFFSSSNTVPDQIGSPAYSISSAPGLDIANAANSISTGPFSTGTSPDPTASLLKNVNKSLLVHSVLNLNNASQTSLDSLTNKYNQTNVTKGTVITPKSRAIPDISSAVVNFAKVKQKHQQQSNLPSMRRMQSTPNVHTSSSTSTTAAGPTTGNVTNRHGTTPAKVSSNLKYSQLAETETETETEHETESEGTRSKSASITQDHNIPLYDAKEQQGKDSTVHSDTLSPIIRKTDKEKKSIDEENDSDSDLEVDSKDKKYNVPQFGGFSNNAKLRAQLLSSSHELFRNLPWKIALNDKGNGAMKNAINTAIIEETIKEPVSWVGTVGIPTDEIPDEITAKISKTLQDEYQSTAVVTDDITFKGAYKNFCKQILWPTLHYQIPDNPNSKAFEDHSWNYYQKLNQQFADQIIKIYKIGDTIWVHDYHLMLVPELVRKVLPNAKIGFSLHVSFPSSEVFRCFAHREKILKGILGSNFVGFQTKEYARHFLQTSNRLLMADVGTDELKFNGKIVSVKYTPVGIDTFTLNDQLKDERVFQWRHLIRERWEGKRLIVCRDQFDRIRGLHKKMLAFERFLKENPEYIEKVVLLQICIGKSSDSELERQIMMVVDRINSLSSNISISQPVVFLHQDLEFVQYLALSCEADMFLVNSLREGMNLTCHEFIVSSEEKNAPLLLSEFTGSASVVKGALLINPWDIRHSANCIKQGLEMSKEEKRRHWKKMMKSVIENDSDNWILSSLQNIHNAWEFNQERSTVFNLAYDTLYTDYKKSEKHMFIFKISEPPTPRMLSILNDLSSKNIVFIMNSFSKVTLESLYNRVLNIGLIAENGAYVRLNGSWYNIVQQVDWKSEVVKIFDDKVERLPGSYYKVADSMIRFHTENAEDQERVASVIGDAITHINTLFDERGIHAYVHKNIVFVQETGLSLAAVQFLLKFYNNTSHPFDNSSIAVTQSENTFTQNGNGQSQIDFMMVTGSSSPVVEPIFRLLKEEVGKATLRSGHSVVYGENVTYTYAKEHITGSNELFTILQNIPRIEKSKN